MLINLNKAAAVHSIFQKKSGRNASDLHQQVAQLCSICNNEAAATVALVTSLVSSG
jgi:hypothetical protein